MDGAVSSVCADEVSIRPIGNNTFMQRVPGFVNALLSLTMLALIWAGDRLTPSQVSMSIFYLLPIAYSAWFCGARWAYAVCVISAGAWLQADLSIHHPEDFWLVPYWNAFVRLGFFVTVAALTHMVVQFRELIAREQQTSRLKTNLISLVSHEFGNALTTFKLSLSVLEATENERHSTSRATCYAALQRVYAHLNSAVTNFLNLNRIERGQFIPNIKRTPLRSAIHETIALLEPVIEAKNIALKLDFPVQAVPVRADPDSISVIMSNLIGNAFKYTPDGGHVTISILIDQANRESCVVSVEDTGIGISNADRQRILGGFYRTARGRELAKGYGVGLMVVRELLESHGSRLQIATGRQGRGSRFYFQLPLWRDEKELNPIVAELKV